MHLNSLYSCLSIFISSKQPLLSEELYSCLFPLILWLTITVNTDLDLVRYLSCIYSINTLISITLIGQCMHITKQIDGLYYCIWKKTYHLLCNFITKYKVAFNKQQCCSVILATVVLSNFRADILL